MIRLTREVRFSLPRDLRALGQPVLNSWAGWPPPQLDIPSFILRTTLAGSVDEQSGYLFNIKRIDEAIRQKIIARSVRDRILFDGEAAFLRFAWQELHNCIPATIRIEQLALCPTPWISWTLTGETGSMILLTQQFEFSAAHRLHNPELSEQKNRELFGKCNNPHGHGHNYLVDVTVGFDDTNDSNAANVAAELESVVRQRVIDRVDHRNLNVEIDEFASLNPTVENIAVVFWSWISNGPCPGTLKNVRVYETPKTWADFSG